MTDERQLVELEGWQHSIGYTLLHSSYGRAEFQVCPVWKRGRIVECWIYPRQQVREPNEYWHLTANSDGLTFGSTGVHVCCGPWHVGWCKEHKTATYSIYAPDGTDQLDITVLSSLSFRFCKGDKL